MGTLELFRTGAWTLLCILCEGVPLRPFFNVRCAEKASVPPLTSPAHVAILTCVMASRSPVQLNYGVFMAALALDYPRLCCLGRTTLSTPPFTNAAFQYLLEDDNIIYIATLVLRMAIRLPALRVRVSQGGFQEKLQSVRH